VCMYTYSLYIEVRIRFLSYEFKPPVKDLIAELCHVSVICGHLICSNSDCGLCRER
jgi:hypothetical protein